MLIGLSFFILYLVFVFIVPIMVISYQRKLSFKFREVAAILSGELGIKYLLSFYPELDKDIGTGSEKDSKPIAINRKIEEFFGNEYALNNFLLPVTAFFLISVIAMLLSLLRIHNFLCISSADSTFLEGISINIYLGFFGAFLFSIIETSRRYISTSLSPLFLYSITSKLLLCSILGYIWGVVLGKDIALLASFGTGFVSLQKIENFIVKYTEKKIEARKEVITRSDLYHIQGISTKIIDRLEEAGITSCQELAYCDPIKLIFRTNYQLKIIVDWIDQALLYIYLHDQVKLLRGLGIRGVIEFATLYEIRKKKSGLLKTISEELAIKSVDELEYFIDTVYNDPHVDFIWYMFSKYSEE